MFYWFIERLSPRRECEKRIRFRDPKASTDPRRWPCTASNNGLQRNNTRANMQIGKLHTFPSNAHCCDRNNRYFNICQSESAADVGWLHMFIRVTNFDRKSRFYSSRSRRKCEDERVYLRNIWPFKWYFVV